MSKMKDIRDTMGNLIKAGREALDLLEEMMELFPAVEAPGVPEVRVEAETETPEKTDDDVLTSCASARVPDESGTLSRSAARPFSSETRCAGLSDEETKMKTATLNDVRTLLAEKARTGFRAEVKALLTAHGAKQLSDITDPVELGAMMAEAEKIGG